MNSDHAGKLFLILYVASLGHQHQVLLPEKEGGGEEPGGVGCGQVMTVEERWVLAFIPRPDKDIVESMVNSMLDGYQEVFIPIPAKVFTFTIIEQIFIS